VKIEVKSQENVKRKSIQTLRMKWKLEWSLKM
jgi:hypothetical protein